jgi:hypothetical protein
LIIKLGVTSQDLKFCGEILLDLEPDERYQEWILNTLGDNFRWAENQQKKCKRLEGEAIDRKRENILLVIN